MIMVSIQKKLAAKILKCGVKRIWIDPVDENVRRAITRKDIKGLIADGKIKKIPEKKRLPNPEKRQQRTGSRKGVKQRKKEQWFKVIRPQRKLIRELKPKLEPRSYRKLYRMIKGNVFRSRQHLLSYLKENEYIKEKKK